MTEKRFTLEQWTEESLYFSDGEFSAHMSIGYICKKVEKKLNEQQSTIRKLQDLCGESDGENAKLRIENNEQQSLITNLQGDVNRLQYIIDELKKDNYKRFEKINELKAKLKEKEEDERLYANEIVKLNKEAKEVLDFKSLGGDY